MFLSNIKNQEFLFKLNTLFFLVLVFYTFSVTNLFFYSTYGADYQKYISYLEYFYGLTQSTGSEQGPLYFSLVSLILNFRSNYISPVLLQSELSFAIQLTNLFIILIGFLGFYLFLKELGVKKNKIIIIFHLLNFFPPLIALRITMKPEILVLALLPWFLYVVQLYLKTHKINYLFAAIVPAALILTSKGSWFGMFLLFGFFLAFNVFKEIKFKNILLLIFILVLLVLLINYENQQVNQYGILDFQITENYNNSADLNIIYKNSESKEHSLYFLKFDEATLLGITLLDTFSDQFNVYWDKDVSLFNNHRKSFLIEDSSINIIKIDFKNRVIKYNGPFSSSLINLRNIAGVILTIVFYLLILFNFFKLKKYKIYIISPFIGMLILLINALGFPVNNFDPNLGDTFKTFYYSPFIVLSFVFMLENIKSKKKFLNVLFIILYLSISIFIIGFPKEDTVNYLSEINERNTHSVLCETNKILINDINFSGDCSEKILEFCKFNSDRKGYETTVKNSYDLENSIFMIKKMITKIDNQEINDFSCKTGQKSSGLLDFSTLPKLNLFLLMSFFLLIFTQKKKYSKV
tara:strand:+ start:232 stop:1965 length:1734 start_codon:yes stop_codon:yes gene_type:complete